jgi:diphosphomevalonate decarboxylase
MVSTFEATPNIALIKYWGKRDSKLVLPQNSSISFTLGNSVKTVTSVLFSDRLKEDVAWLNRKKTSGEELARMLLIADLVRQKASISSKVAIASENNFPTAAGIASSASGFAALACAASDAAGLGLNPTELSILARMASGSACRSVLGGFVEWKKGEEKDGGDSHAVQIAPASHWPELHDLIAVAESGRKKIGSSAGMDRTVKTSGLYAKRILDLPSRIAKMRQAIMLRDSQTVFALSMEDSMNMHATMLDTKPPILYLNERSMGIIEAIEELNASEGKLVCGYTFDAGPNAHLICEGKDVAKVKKSVAKLHGIEKFYDCIVGAGPIKLAAKESLLSEAGKPV